MSTRDSLGQLRLSEQTWYDIETRQPIRRRELLQVADRVKYNREYTPMDPTRFPPGIFDGEKFLDAARKAGAKILVD